LSGLLEDMFIKQSRTIICSLPGSDGKGIYILKSIQCDTDNCIVAAFHDDGSMCIWDVRARKHLHTIKPHDELAHCCNVVGLKMMTSSSDGTCALSNWESGQIVWKKKLGEPEIWVDRKWVGNAVYAQTEWEGKVAAATKDGMLRVFDLESGSVFFPLLFYLVTKVALILKYSACRVASSRRHDSKAIPL
jgi:WD40 repeat protein